jgi:hypothetical protein
MGAKMCCENKKLYDLGVDKEMFLQMLSEEPDLSKYQFWDQKTVKELKKLWKSKVFGGHVFQPVGEAPGTSRTRQNVLQDQINLFQIEYLYGGGYYVLENVLIQNKDNYNNITFSEPRVKADDSWSFFGGSSTMASS